MIGSLFCFFFFWWLREQSHYLLCAETHLNMSNEKMLLPGESNWHVFPLHKDDITCLCPTLFSQTRALKIVIFYFFFFLTPFGQTLCCLFHKIFCRAVIGRLMEAPAWWLSTERVGWVNQPWWNKNPPGLTKKPICLMWLNHLVVNVPGSIYSCSLRHFLVLVQAEATVPGAGKFM